MRKPVAKGRQFVGERDRWDPSEEIPYLEGLLRDIEEGYPVDQLGNDIVGISEADVHRRLDFLTKRREGQIRREKSTP